MKAFYSFAHVVIHRLCKLLCKNNSIRPFFEELFFRGVLFNSFRARWGLAAGVVASAAVFALVHPLPFGFLPIFALGSVFSMLFYQRGSLIPNMVAHGLHNAITFAILILVAS